MIRPGSSFSGDLNRIGQVRRIAEYGWAIGIIGVTSGVALALRQYLQTIDIAMLFLLAVVIVAYRFRRGPAVAASLLSIALFDFGFVPPYSTFGVRDPAFFLTFLVMLAVALAMSQLTGEIREQAEESKEREQRAASLYALSRDLTNVPTLSEQLAVATRHLSDAAPGAALILLQDSDDGWAALGQLEDVVIRVAAAFALEHGEAAGWGTSHCAEAEALVIPLRAPSRIAGVVVVRPEKPDGRLSPRRRRLLEALADQAAVSFERAQLAERHQRAQMEVESERLRTALLSSLSHDLRSPLGSIEGAASSLLEGSGKLSDQARREMAETIVEESRRMTRLIANLLDMVRVESGALAVKKEWQPLEEALGVALLRLEEKLDGHPVETRLPATLPLVPIDDLLIEQVFINLLENATRHTPPGTPIRISAWADNGSVIVEVADQGDGIAPGEEETIFRKFHRSSQADRTAPAGGSGLGLTICRGIITAHGGKIWLERNGTRGAAFRFTLPLDGPAPAAVPPEIAD